MLTSVPPGDNNYYDAPPTGFFRTSAAIRTIVVTHPATSAAIIDRCSTSMTMTRCCAYERHRSRDLPHRRGIARPTASANQSPSQVPILRETSFRAGSLLEREKRDVQEGNEMKLKERIVKFFALYTHIDSQSRKKCEICLSFPR